MPLGFVAIQTLKREPGKWLKGRTADVTKEKRRCSRQCC